MTERERTVAALEGRQPDAVPHFELEMQLTEEYFGSRYTTRKEWEAEPGNRSRFLRHDAELQVKTADHFDYGIVFISGVYRPDFDDMRENLRIVRELDSSRRLVMVHGEATPGIPTGGNMDTVITEMMMYPERTREAISKRVDWRLEWARTPMVSE